MANQWRRVLATVCLLALLAPGPAVEGATGGSRAPATQAGPVEPNRAKVAPEVRLAIETAGPHVLIPIIITLKDQADLDQVAAPDRDTRVRAVVRLLRQTADVTQQPLRDFLRAEGARGRATPSQRLWVFNGLVTSARASVIESVAARSDVARVSLNRTFSAPTLTIGGSPIESNVDRIGAPAVWDRGIRGQGVVVATLDTGVSLSHASLVATWRGGANSWFDPHGQHPATPTDLDGHGTEVMGVIVGGDEGGTAVGVAPDAQWIAAKIFDDAGETTAADVHLSYQWLLDPDGDPGTADAPHVVNNSWTYTVPGCSLEFQLDLQALRAANILPVFSAGNTGPAPAVNVSPANNPEAFAVGAVDSFDTIYFQSGRGPSSCGEPPTIFPELVAPGVGIRSMSRQGTYVEATGTSLSAPHVAGALALLLSANPDLTAEEQAAALLMGGVDLGAGGADNDYGYGRLDVLAALDSLAIQPASTIMVNLMSDVIASDTFCSLREALVAANTDAPFQDCPGGSGADMIAFSPGLSYPLTITLAVEGRGEDGALTGDLDVEGTLTISATQPVTIDGAGLDRIFDVRPGAQATLSGVSVQGGDPGPGGDGAGIRVRGRLTMSEGVVAHNQGSGIHNDAGLVTLSNVTVHDNVGYGLRQENIASLIVVDATVRHNQGGGVRSSSSTASLTRVRVLSNTVGGGVLSIGTGITPGQLTMNACQVLSNTASNGGGIFSQGVGTRATIRNTDVGGNVATMAGGGVFTNGTMRFERGAIYGNQARSGGGMDHSGVSLSMSNATISGNTADDNGGGLHNRGDSVLTNVTIALNGAGGPENGGNIFNDEAQLSLGNTIVASAISGGNCFNSAGSINSLGHNLDSGTTCGFGASGDLTGTDPLLGPLQDNGGATLTHALMPGSPAIDSGDDEQCVDEDQRGVTRPQGEGCDIGAYEHIPGAIADVWITKGDDPDAVLTGGTLTYTLEVGNAGPDSATTVRITDTLPTEVAFQDAAGDGWVCGEASGSVTCAKATLAPDAVETILIWVTAPLTTGVIVNHAWIDATEVDLDRSDNHAAETTTIEPKLDFHHFLPLVLRPER